MSWSVLLSSWECTFITIEQKFLYLRSLCYDIADRKGKKRPILATFQILVVFMLSCSNRSLHEIPQFIVNIAKNLLRLTRRFRLTIESPNALRLYQQCLDSEQSAWVCSNEIYFRLQMQPSPRNRVTSCKGL